jgi:protein-tyrosine kinase
LSKIFDALRKTQGEVASLVLPLVHTAGKTTVAIDQHATVTQVASAQPAGTPDDAFRPVHIEELRSERVARIVVHSELLRMRLRSHWAAGKLKSVLITSALPEDGKTTVALNLATVLMEERTRRVLLIDADLHRGSVDQRLGLLPQIGLSECLQQGIPPLTVIRRVEPFGWHLLSSGKVRSHSPTQVLQPREISNLIQALSPHFDWIVVDSPPVLRLSDAVAMRHHLDGTILVAKAGVTPAKAVEDAIGLVGKRHIVGLVLNGIEKRDQPYASLYHYYSSK